jgi:hypothetical protein
MATMTRTKQKPSKQLIKKVASAAANYKSDTADDIDNLKRRLAMYEGLFEEIERFTDLLDEQEREIAELAGEMATAKQEYEDRRDDLNSAREARDGTEHALFMFLRPGPGQIMPLFDRMDPADDDKHGTHSSEWRKEPIATLRLSLPACTALATADILFVGQLQDRVQADSREWWTKVDGLTNPMAQAIADKLNDFINEQVSK